jgi:hypothetical protein
MAARRNYRKVCNLQSFSWETEIHTMVWALCFKVYLSCLKTSETEHSILCHLDVLHILKTCVFSLVTFYTSLSFLALVS